MSVETEDDEVSEGNLLPMCRVIERVYMIQDMFDTHVGDDDLLAHLPEDCVAQINSIGKDLNKLFQTLHMHLIVPEGRAN